MTLKIYNTRVAGKEPFQPREPGKVRMYVCGVTTYDLCHMGHARYAVVFDVVFRSLRHQGFDVTYVRNHTDVDDKIIARAHRENCTPMEVADRFVEATEQDMLALGCLPPTHQPRVTDHMQDIIDLVKRLVERGHAYESGGDVYFSVASFPRYGELSRRNLDDLRSGARIEVSDLKRNPLDFALWKRSKPGEPAWDSPWGPGRPGWHIECSAMGMKYLSETLDIHGGGADLIFPHHENEIAQSEAATGRTFARYWMHNGMITINKEKMSKSLNNFFTIRDALRRFARESIRLFLLSTQYRSPADFSDTSLEEAEAGLERLYQAIARAETLLARDKTRHGPRIREALEANAPLEMVRSAPWTSGAAPWDVPDGKLSEAESELLNETRTAQKQFEEAMDDDFNTARAIGYLFEVARGIGRFAIKHKKGSENSALAVGAALAVLRGLGRGILGILEMSPLGFQEDLNYRRLQWRDISTEEIDAAIQERQQARAKKDWARADEIRQALILRGVSLEDTAQGTVWKVISRTATGGPE